LRGKLAKPDKYEEDISLICASGIRFFLSIEAALSYEDGNINYYDPDGKIKFVLSSFQ
jgi:hypothetical protein